MVPESNQDLTIYLRIYTILEVRSSNRFVRQKNEGAWVRKWFYDNVSRCPLATTDKIVKRVKTGDVAKIQKNSVNKICDLRRT